MQPDNVLFLTLDAEVFLVELVEGALKREDRATMGIVTYLPLLVEMALGDSAGDSLRKNANVAVHAHSQRLFQGVDHLSRSLIDDDVTRTGHLHHMSLILRMGKLVDVVRFPAHFLHEVLLVLQVPPNVALDFGLAGNIEEAVQPQRFGFFPKFLFRNLRRQQDKLRDFLRSVLSVHNVFSLTISPRIDLGGVMFLLVSAKPSNYFIITYFT